MSSVSSITSAVAVAMVTAAVPGALSAQVTSTRDTARVPWDVSDVEWGTTAAADAADSLLIRQAVAGNAFEVRLGRIAQSRAQDSRVEDFARQMVEEHGSMSRQWATLARNNRVTVDTDPTSSEQQTLDRMEDLSGTAFDRAYMTEMIRRHEQDLAAFHRAAGSARSQEVRRLAASGAADIREHLALARQIGSSLGVSSVAATTPDTARRTTVARTSDERDRQRDRNARGDLRGEDWVFAQEARQDHLMHIRLAERAQREARRPETRRFAEDMGKVFTRWQERWRELASRNDVRPTRELDRLHRMKVDRLERASGQEVDRIYASMVADDLASIVSYFQDEGQAVKAGPVRRLVDDELPVLREHLARARRLEGPASARAERD